MCRCTTHWLAMHAVLNRRCHLAVCVRRVRAFTLQREFADEKNHLAVLHDEFETGLPVVCGALHTC